jgi:cytochrome P450
VAARSEDGEPMDDAEIRDQLMTLLIGGHETTATGLAWTFDLLVRHPAVLERLVADADADEQAYARAVVSESLRLRPVVPLAGGGWPRRCASTGASYRPGRT